MIEISIPFLELNARHHNNGTKQLHFSPLLLDDPCFNCLEYRPGIPACRTDGPGEAISDWYGHHTSGGGRY